MSALEKPIEIEIQVQVENPSELVKFLEENGQFQGDVRQVDTYYTPAHRDFTSLRPIKEWLRLRESSGKYSINYKNWHFDSDGRSHHCDEYETAVESLEMAEKILAALDMKKLVVVDKNRRIWNYQDYEVALDSVQGLGDFVEIEFKGKLADKLPAEITAEMVNFIQRFDVGQISRNYVGYPFQMLFPNEVEYEII